MSVWRQREKIEQAVAGLLSAADEARLRAHLEGCAECRREYDRLSMQARILAGDPHGTKSSAARELQRLMGVLEPATAPAPVPRPRWVWGLAAVAAALLLVVGLRTRAPAEEISLRGGPSPTTAVRVDVVLYAAPTDGGAIDSRATFPAQRSTRVRPDEWVAFQPSGAPAAFFRAVLLGETGQTIILERGKSVALDPGRWRLFAVTGHSYDDRALQQAAQHAPVGWEGLPLPDATQTLGEVVVAP